MTRRRQWLRLLRVLWVQIRRLCLLRPQALRLRHTRQVWQVLPVWRLRLLRPQLARQERQPVRQERQVLPIWQVLQARQARWNKRGLM
jgi:hypothetical protein